MNALHSPEWSEEEIPSLEQVMGRYSDELEVLAQPGIALTAQRLARVAPHLRSVVQYADELDVGWPDETTAVVDGTEQSLRFSRVTPEEADKVFAYRLLHNPALVGKPRAYNNFPALLRAQPDRPEGRSLHDFLARNPSAALYGSKPYLWRAHMLYPDFMRALQEEMELQGGMSSWGDALLSGAVDPEAYPREAALLRASRLSYDLLTNLMRKDDLQRQKSWFDMDNGQAAEITDPAWELWT